MASRIIPSRPPASQYGVSHCRPAPPSPSQYGGAHCRNPSPRVLICTLDTLVLSYRVAFDPSTISLLQNLQLYAHQHRYPCVTIAGLPFSLHHNHAGALVSPGTMTIFLRPYPYYTTVELRSRYLHHHSYCAAVATVRRVLRQLLPDPLASERVSRVDLHADLVGWPQFGAVPVAGVPAGFVSLARKRRPTEYGGFQFGGWHGRRSSTSVSIYRKDDAKPWLQRIWRDRGWTGEAVHRVEFRIPRRRLHALGIDTPEQLRSAVPALWENLTHRWLRLHEERPGSKRRRWPVHPAWRCVQRAVPEVERQRTHQSAPQSGRGKRKAAGETLSTDAVVELERRPQSPQQNRVGMPQ